MNEIDERNLSHRIEQLMEELRRRASISIVESGGLSQIENQKLILHKGLPEYDKAIDNALGSLHTRSHAILALLEDPLYRASIAIRLDIETVKENIATVIDLIQQGKYQDIRDKIHTLIATFKRAPVQDEQDQVVLSTCLMLYSGIRYGANKMQYLTEPIPEGVDPNLMYQVKGITQLLKQDHLNSTTLIDSQISTEIALLKARYNTHPQQQRILSLIDEYYDLTLQVQDILTQMPYKEPFELLGLTQNVLSNLANDRQKFADSEFGTIGHVIFAEYLLMRELPRASQQYKAPLFIVAGSFDRMYSVAKEMKALTSKT